MTESRIQLLERTVISFRNDEKNVFCLYYMGIVMQNDVVNFSITLKLCIMRHSPLYTNRCCKKSLEKY